MNEREKVAQAYTAHPALLRLLELEALRDLSRSANARLYITLDKASAQNHEEKD